MDLATPTFVGQAFLLLFYNTIYNNPGELDKLYWVCFTYSTKFYIVCLLVAITSQNLDTNFLILVLNVGM